MHKFRFHFIFLLLFSLGGLSGIFARSSASISTLSRVPADSILVLSVDGKNDLQIWNSYKQQMASLA